MEIIYTYVFFFFEGDPMAYTSPYFPYLQHVSYDTCFEFLKSKLENIQSFADYQGFNNFEAGCLTGPDLPRIR